MKKNIKKSMNIADETICIRKDAIVDLMRVKGEFDAIVESIALTADEAFMDSYKKSKQQVRKRIFDDWDTL